MKKKTIIENKKLKTGPAATVKKRAQSGAPCIVLLLYDEDFFSKSFTIGLLAEFWSPKNFTNPPRGNAAICHFVPLVSYLKNKTGPKPIEKTSAWIPQIFPMK